MSKKRILVVDDETDLVDMLKIRLEANGYQVISAYDGRQALEKAQKEIIHHIQNNGSLASVDFKYLINTTRKFAIPLLDHFDKIQVTRRQRNNTRHLGPAVR